MLTVGSALLVVGGLFNFNNKPAALKAAWDFVASPTGHFLESRAAILGQVTKNLMLKAAEDPGTPLVLHPVRRTWALREIETRMQRAGLPLHIEYPAPVKVSPVNFTVTAAPRISADDANADPLRLLADIEARANQKRSGQLAERFAAAARGIDEVCAHLKEPEVRQAADGFRTLLLQAARILPQERQTRPATRAEAVAESLRDYAALTDDVRGTVKADFAAALAIATANLREEIERKNGATADDFRARLSVLTHDHL